MIGSNSNLRSCKHGCGRTELFCRGLCRQCYYTPQIRILYSQIRKTKQWKVSEIEKLREFRNKGYSFEQCRQILNVRTVCQVISICKKYRIIVRPYNGVRYREKIISLIESKKTDKEIANIVRMSRSGVSTLRRKLGYPSAVSKEEQIKRMTEARLKKKYRCWNCTNWIPRGTRPKLHGWISVPLKDGSSDALLRCKECIDKYGPPKL